MIKRNFLLLVSPIPCPLCVLVRQNKTYGNIHECSSYPSTPTAASSMENSLPVTTYQTPSALADHLREVHSLALFNNNSNNKRFHQHQNISSSIGPMINLIRKDSFLKDKVLGTSASRKTKQIVRLSSCLDHFDRKSAFSWKNSRTGYCVYSCTSQASQDAVSALCRIYARLAIGKIPLLFPTNYKKSCIAHNHHPASSSSLIFIDFANQPDIFDHFQGVDPGAELFLSRRAIIIVIWEPRVHISKLLSSPFARNAMLYRRIFVHQCRRDRESGDLAMADVIARVNFEIQQTVYLNCEEELETRMDDTTGDDPMTRHKFHLVGNDLRHRRCMQDIVGKDLIVGHHSFENTAHHWETTLRNLILKCLPCACGSVIPKNTKFPHAELCLHLQSNSQDGGGE